MVAALGQAFLGMETHVLEETLLLDSQATTTQTLGTMCTEKSATVVTSRFYEERGRYHGN